MDLFGIGGIASAGASALAAHLSYKTAKENREWQERMSNTAHQREVKDLRAAGLNPILTATGGSGATTPTANTTADFSGIERAMSNALSFRQAKEEIKTQQSQQDLNKTTANKVIHEGDLAHYNAVTAREQAQLLMDFGAEKMRAEIAQINSGTAKNYQDMLNSISFTNAQIKNLDANTAKSTKEANAVTKRTGAGIVIPKFGELGYYRQE